MSDYLELIVYARARDAECKVDTWADFERDFDVTPFREICSLFVGGMDDDS